MNTAQLITNYEAHLEANWTREGERKPSTFEMRWENIQLYPDGFLWYGDDEAIQAELERIAPYAN